MADTPVEEVSVEPPAPTPAPVVVAPLDNTVPIMPQDWQGQLDAADVQLEQSRIDRAAAEAKAEASKALMEPATQEEKDALSWWGYPGRLFNQGAAGVDDMLRGVGRTVEALIGNIPEEARYSYVDDAGNVTMDKAYSIGPKGSTIPRGEEVGPAIIRGLVEFGSGMAITAPIGGVGAIPKLVAKSPKLAAAFHAAGTSALIMDPEEVTDVQALAMLTGVELGAFSEYLETGKEEGFWSGKLKHVLGSTVTDAGMLFIGYKILLPIARKWRSAKGAAAAGDLTKSKALQAEASEELAEATAKTLDEATPQQKAAFEANVKEELGAKLDEVIPEVDHPIRKVLSKESDEAAAKAVDAEMARLDEADPMFDAADEVAEGVAKQDIPVVQRYGDEYVTPEGTVKALDDTLTDADLEALARGGIDEVDVGDIPRYTRALQRQALEGGYHPLMERIVKAIQAEKGDSAFFTPQGADHAATLAKRISDTTSEDDIRKMFNALVEDQAEVPGLIAAYDKLVETAAKNVQRLEDEIVAVGMDAPASKLLEFATASENLKDMVTKQKMGDTLGGRWVNSYKNRSLGSLNSSVYSTMDYLERLSKAMGRDANLPEARVEISMPNGSTKTLKKSDITEAQAAFHKQVREAIEGYGGADAILKRAQFRKEKRADLKLDKLAQRDKSLGWELVNTYYIANLLSGPVTQAVNVTSGAIQTVMLPMERITGGAVVGMGTTLKRSIAKGEFTAGDWNEFVEGWHHLFAVGSTLTDFQQIKQMMNAASVASSLRDPSALIQNVNLVGAAAKKAEIPGIFQTLTQDGSLRPTAKGSKLVKYGSRALLSPLGVLSGADEFMAQLNFRASLKADATMWASDVVRSRVKEGFYSTPKALADYKQGLVAEAQVEAFSRIERQLAKKTIDASTAAAKKEAVLAKIHKDVETIVEQSRKLGGLEADIQARDFRVAVKGNMDTVMADPVTLGSKFREIAERATFTEEAPAWAKPITQLTRYVPPLKMVIPFVSTPANILRYTAQMNPAWWVCSEAVNVGKRLWHGPEVEKWALMGERGAQEAASRWGKLVLGTSMMVAGLELADRGVITGGLSSDPERAAAQRSAGFEPYSVHAFGRYWPIGRINPFPGILLMGWADINDAFKEKEKGASTTAVISDIAASIRDLSLGQTFLSGTKEALDAFMAPSSTIGAKLIKMGEGVAKGFSPLSTLSKQINVTAVGTRADSRLFGQRFLEVLPFGWAYNSLTPRIDILTGEPQAVPWVEAFAMGTPIDSIDAALIGERKGHTILAKMPDVPAAYDPNGTIFGVNLRAEAPDAYFSILKRMGTTTIDGKSLNDHIEALPEWGNKMGFKREFHEFAQEGYSDNPYYKYISTAFTAFRRKAVAEEIRDNEALRSLIMLDKTKSHLLMLGIASGHQGLDDMATQWLEDQGITP